MSIKPTRDQILIENIEEETMVNGLHVPFQCAELVRKKVLAKGPLVCDDIQVGDVVLSPGKKSGVDMGDGTYLISEQICFAVEKEE